MATHQPPQVWETAILKNGIIAHNFPINSPIEGLKVVTRVTMAVLEMSEVRGRTDLFSFICSISSCEKISIKQTSKILQPVQQICVISPATSWLKPGFYDHLCWEIH